MNRKVLLAPVIIAVAIGGYHFYRIHSVQRQLEPVAVRDNILITEVLEVEQSSPNITFAEYLDKLVKNRDERDELKRKVEEIEPYGNREIFAQYIRLFDLENDYVRTEEARVRQMARYLADKKELEAATKRGEEAVQRIQIGQASFVSESGLERTMARDSEHTLDAVSMWAIKSEFKKSSREDLSKSATELTEAVANSMKAADTLTRGEQTYYPNFLPSRNLAKKASTGKKECLREHSRIR